MSYHYLLDIALILLSTKLLGILTRRIQMPQVVGALLAGLILGPAMLNILTETEFLSRLSELGVIVLMFTAGMGTDIEELKKSGKSGFLVALCGVLAPLFMGAALTWAAGRWGLISPTSFVEDVFMGTVLTATSVSITVETLQELGKLNTRVGNTILAAALIDDVLGLIALTIVGSLAGGGDSIGLVLLKIVLFFVFVAAVFFVGLRFFRWLIKLEKGQNLRRYPVLAFVLCLLMAFCAERFFGVADITGAYAAGLLISMTPKAKYIESKFEPLSYLLLTPIFFAGIGINVERPQMTGNLIAFSLLFLLISILSKVVGCGIGARISGFNGRESLRVGVGMACRGEVALIVANRGISMGVVSAELMPPIILTVVGVTILTPVLLKLMFRNEPETLEASGLVDHYEESEQLDMVSEQLLQENRKLMGPPAPQRPSGTSSR